MKYIAVSNAPDVSEHRRLAVPDRIIVGKDILELVSGAMYVDPLSVYREYIQNSSDAIDQRFLVEPKGEALISVELDVQARTVRISDNGIGVSNQEFIATMTAIGGSSKRTIPGSRGFRGVGRLSGLGYCRALTFRSKGIGDGEAMQITWDCVRFKQILRDGTYKGNLENVIRDVTRIEAIPSRGRNAFFEVELTGVVRLKNDVLLNGQAIRNYLAQTAAVPFDVEFPFAQEIEAHLGSHGVSLGYAITLEERGINGGASERILRPHKRTFDAAGGKLDQFSDVQLIKLEGLDGQVAAIGWIANHSYFGAIPNDQLIKGVRFRVGNIQIGDVDLMSREFPESRFNAWSVGEVHILSPFVVPNGRRDNFEENAHYENLVGQLVPHLREIGRECRQRSARRQWQARFNGKVELLLEDIKMLERGSLGKRRFLALLQGVEKGVIDLDAVIRNSRYEWATELRPKVNALEKRIARLRNRREGEDEDPLFVVPYQKRIAFQELLALVYEVSPNKPVGNALVDKVIKRIAVKYGAKH